MDKPYSKEEYKKLKEQEYNELQQKLDAGIKDALNSDKYKDFLKTMSKFYNYSAYNSILIGLQNENATFVASAKNWAKQNVKINEEENSYYKVQVANSVFPSSLAQLEKAAYVYTAE